MHRYTLPPRVNAGVFRCYRPKETMRNRTESKRRDKKYYYYCLPTKDVYHSNEMNVISDMGSIRMDEDRE